MNDPGSGNGRFEPSWHPLLPSITSEIDKGLSCRAGVSR
jgi:hypothetical protein